MGEEVHAGPVTKEEANRDFSKKSGESRQQFYLRAAASLKNHLEALGLPVDDPTVSLDTNSVYLKSKEFDIGISDHGPKPSKQFEPSAKPEFRLVIKGTGVSAKRINKLLSDIVARHKE